MFNTTQKDSNLEKSINAVHQTMETKTPGTPEYDTLADQLTKLYKLREHNARKTVSPDTLIMAGANLLGIAVIVFHEREHVITTKALSFLGKSK